MTCVTNIMPFTELSDVNFTLLMLIQKEDFTDRLLLVAILTSLYEAWQFLFFFII